MTHFKDMNLNPPSLSDSGTFLGLGTVTGSVAIYISFSLQVKFALTAMWTNQLPVLSTY